MKESIEDILNKNWQEYDYCKGTDTYLDSSFVNDVIHKSMHEFAKLYAQNLLGEVKIEILKQTK